MSWYIENKNSDNLLWYLKYIGEHYSGIDM